MLVADKSKLQSQLDDKIKHQGRLESQIQSFIRDSESKLKEILKDGLNNKEEALGAAEIQVKEIRKT